jgi:hypothetical protein
MVMSERGRILLERGSYDELTYQGKVIGTLGVHIGPEEELVLEVGGTEVSIKLRPAKGRR